MKSLLCQVLTGPWLSVNITLVLPFHTVVMRNVVSFQSQAGRQSREISRVTGRGRINHSTGKELISDTLEEPQYCKVKTTKNPTWNRKRIWIELPACSCLQQTPRTSQQEVPVRVVSEDGQRAGLAVPGFCPLCYKVVIPKE